jgi:hypothetical protein
MGIPTTQAEIGHAALRVGGSVLSGMRTLGGMALSVAKSRVVSAGSGSPSRHAAGEESGGGVARFFLRSAPSEGVSVVGEREEEQRRERRYSSTSSGLSASPGAGAGALHALAGVQVPEGGCWVSVVYLAPLWLRRESGMGMGMREPEKVAEFLVSKDKHVVGLRFSSDGCAVVVVPRDGQVAQMFQLRLQPSVGKVLGDVGVEKKKGKRPSVGVMAVKREMRMPWHVYELRRGRPSAVVEAVEYADDGRWVAIGDEEADGPCVPCQSVWRQA